jgi:hypothetical protein
MAEIDVSMIRSFRLANKKACKLVSPDKFTNIRAYKVLFDNFTNIIYEWRKSTINEKKQLLVLLKSVYDMAYKPKEVFYKLPLEKLELADYNYRHLHLIFSIN